MSELSFTTFMADTLPEFLHTTNTPAGAIGLCGLPAAVSPASFSGESYSFHAISSLPGTPFTGCVYFLCGDENSFLALAAKHCQEKQIPLVIVHSTLMHPEKSLAAREALSAFSFLPESSKAFTLAETPFLAEQASEVSQSLFAEYSRWLSSSLPEKNTWRLSAFVPQNLEKKAEREQTHPFLSVIMRTQGNRTEELREVLLCLTAQKNTNFELLLMGHNVAMENTQAITRLIEETPEFFRQRIFYHAVSGGNRSTPLNKGFALARGEYISVLDDDDLVTADWVSLFFNTAQENSGKILHAYSLRQNWQKSPEGKLYATQPAQPAYCTNFNYALQLGENQCPFMSLAFPAAVFRSSSLRFSEELDVMEDWDFLMRFALLSGVADIPTATSIYRMWQEGKTSRTLHSQQQWEKQYHSILKNLDAYPLLLDKNSASLLAEQNRQALALGQINPQNQNSSMLYVDFGGGFAEEHTILQINHLQEPAFLYRFALPPSSTPLATLRFDPAINGECAVENFSVAFYTSAGEKIVAKEIKTTHNGAFLEDTYFFLLDDPQIIFAPPAGISVAMVEVSGQLLRPIPKAKKQHLFGYLLQQTKLQVSPSSRLAQLFNRLRKGKSQ